jgi:glycosyltransferase involved in cell wall biosynthesis
VAGEGPLRGEMEDRFRSAGLEARFDGFLQQDRLSEAYASARLFHFPSRNDVWGIVVQEALQCGTVVVASPHAGAARELVAADGAGLVLPLDLDAWICATLDLLADAGRCAAFRAAGRRALRAYTPARARDAYIDRLDAVLRPSAGQAAAQSC